MTEIPTIRQSSLPFSGIPLWVFPTMGQIPSIPLDSLLGYILKNRNKFDPQSLKKKSHLFMLCFLTSVQTPRSRGMAPPWNSFYNTIRKVDFFFRTPPMGGRSHICKPSWHCPQNPDLHKNCRVYFVQFHGPSDPVDTLDDPHFTLPYNLFLPLKAQGLPWT